MTSRVRRQWRVRCPRLTATVGYARLAKDQAPDGPFPLTINDTQRQLPLSRMTCALSPLPLAKEDLFEPVTGRGMGLQRNGAPLVPQRTQGHVFL